MKLLPVVVLALGLAMPSLAAAQAPDEELRAGVDEVKAGDFKGGAVTLDRVVERLSNAPGHKQELAAAYLYLGIAQAGLGQETLAKAKLRQAFIHSRAAGYAPSDLSIDPALPPRIIQLFEEVKKEMLAAPTVEDAAPSTSRPAASAGATIYVYWPPQQRGAGSIKVQCDDQLVAKLPRRRFIVLSAAPGTHSIKFHDRSISANFEGGQEHYVRVSAEGFIAHAVLRIVPKDEAVAEMRDEKVTLNDAKKTFSTQCVAPPATPAKRNKS